MKIKIMILNVLNYSKEDKEGTRVSYVLCDKSAFTDNDRFKGLTEVNSFYSSKTPFELITPDMIGKPLDANFVDKESYNNPLKTTKVLESIDFNGRTIKLV